MSLDRSRLLCLAALGAVSLTVACGSPDGASEEDAAAREPATEAPADEALESGATAGFEGPVDAELAARGDSLFTARACASCHTVGGGRLVGPDLAGVAERRSLDWILAMITAPDSMVREDSTAKALFAEFLTPMPDQGLTREEARAIAEHLRAAGEGS